MFGCGTACVICPVDRIVYEGKELYIPTMDTGAHLCNRYLNELADIQFGRVQHDWAPIVC